MSLSQIARWTGPAERPSREDQLKLASKTRKALDEVMNNKAAQGQLVKHKTGEPEYVSYTPKPNAPGANPNITQRTLRMVEKAVDPLEPPKFKHKRVPRGPPSPPPPILHSPTRKLTAEDQANWKIPPSVSNWKNRNGMTIPLDKRIQADGRRLQDLSMNEERFAAVSEALQIAEKAAREEIKIRNDMLKQKKRREEEIREEKLRELAAKSRVSRIQSANMSDPVNKEESSEIPDEESEVRKDAENRRKRELEREFRMEKAGVKTKKVRDQNREISERVALGQAQPTSQESLFDARLFNQSAGMDSGFEGGDDEKYSAFDKPLFADRSQHGIYHFEKDRLEESVGVSVPAFAGADHAVQRTTPVQFEKDTTDPLDRQGSESSADPFGLSSLLADIDESRK
eukprot:GHVP01036476.1.p1 GENE.GHVP01036476.1~~GHVP01036476.1.p1  ORF type:complete len:418 (-),score=95.18 GHVP01036476.1:241-1440(-)